MNMARDERSRRVRYGMTAKQIVTSESREFVTPLARLRYEHRLTLRQVCIACGIASTSMLQAYEAGRCRPREYSRRLTLAHFYATTVDELFPPKQQQLRLGWGLRHADG